MNRLSVVLPAYNEELMVGKTCRVLKEVLTEAEIPYELVVVNDGSADGTWAEIEKAGKKKRPMSMHISKKINILRFVKEMNRRTS